MKYRNVFQRGIILILVVCLLSGCGAASPTPVILVPADTSIPAPVVPPAAQPAATEELAPTEEPAAATSSPAATGADLTTTADGTATVEILPTTANPLDLPFLMKIDRISVIVGRGTLLEGRVTHGTLQGSGEVKILGPQEQVFNASVLAVLISSLVRDQVTVGDYAGILVEGIDTNQLSPGMLLTELDAYESYEEALQNLQ